MIEFTLRRSRYKNKNKADLNWTLIYSVFIMCLIELI